VVGAKVAGAATAPVRKVWFSFEGGLYFSTGKDASGQDYEAGKTWMVAFDPMIEIQTVDRGRFKMYHGVMGMSYNLLFGPDFDKFTNVAFKLRPIGVIINNRFNIAYNLRVYPRGFTADQFGKIPTTPSENKSETVHSFSVGFRY
jgi:hypothetical protein